jgi:hypothetical protein
MSVAFSVWSDLRARRLQSVQCHLENTRADRLSPPGHDVVPEATLYRIMKKDESGGWQEGDPQGSRNASTKGARTPQSVAGNKLRVYDIEPVGPNGMVGPSYTGADGLSASLVPLPVRPGLSLGETKASRLPEGLAAVNDYGQHVTIFPGRDMAFSEFQLLLNQIPWH